MTRFEEIICSSETAKAFMSVCSLRHWILEGFYNWQTLIAGLLAVGSAILTVCLLGKQINIQKKSLNAQINKDYHDNNQKIKAALISIPRALSEIQEYINGCYYSWEIQNIARKPSQPKDAVSQIMKAAPYVEEDVFEIFKKFIVLLQMFESRLLNVSVSNQDNHFNQMIIDITALSYDSWWLYIYSLHGIDRTTPYCEPSATEMYDHVVKILDTKVTSGSLTHKRIMDAWKDEYGEWQQQQSNQT